MKKKGRHFLNMKRALLCFLQKRAPSASPVPTAMHRKFSNALATVLTPSCFHLAPLWPKCTCTIHFFFVKELLSPRVLCGQAEILDCLKMDIFHFKSVCNLNSSLRNPHDLHHHRPNQVTFGTQSLRSLNKIVYRMRSNPRKLLTYLNN